MHPDVALVIDPANRVALECEKSCQRLANCICIQVTDMEFLERIGVRELNDDPLPCSLLALSLIEGSLACPESDRRVPCLP